jgi:hypothetical protein
MIRLTRLLTLALALLHLTLTAGAPNTRAQTTEPRAWDALGPTDQPVSRIYTPTSGALFVATEQDLFRSDDGGLTWVVVSGPPGTSVATVSPVNHDLLYAAGTGGVYRSEDGGSSWQRVSDQAGGWSRFEVSPADPSVVYGDTSTESTASGVTTIRHERRVSHDAGATWEVTHTYDERRVSGSYPCAHSVKEFQPHATDSARLLTIEGCSVRGDPVSRMSYDEGRTSVLFPEVNMLDWSSNGVVGGQGANPNRWYVALFRSNVLYTRIHHSKLLRSDDDGASWTTVFEDDSGEPYSPGRKGVDFVRQLTYDPQRPDHVFAVFERYELNAEGYKELKAAGYTVRRSRDGGATWTELGARDLPEVSGLVVGVDGRQLYARTRSGVYRIALTE